MTAEHCAHGSEHVVVVAGREYRAEVAWRGGRADVDIAVSARRICLLCSRCRARG